MGDRHRIYVDQVTPTREVIMTVTLGEPYPLHAGASSRALLAFMPEERIEAYINSGPLESLTARTIIDPQRLREDLEMVRKQGWAQSTGERKNGAASVAAPVRNHEGYAVAVVSVCGPMERFQTEIDDCREALLHTARVLSRRYGFEG